MKTITFIAGTFDNNGGKLSGLALKVFEILKDKYSKEYNFDIVLYNGGFYNTLPNLLETVKQSDITFWWANVPNDLPKIRNIKEINYKTISVTSKRNDDDKYSFQEILQRMLEQKANLNVIFKKEDNKFRLTLCDPLGNVYYDGFDLVDFSSKLIKRLLFLTSITRTKTINSGNITPVKFYYDIFDDLKNAIKDISESKTRILASLDTEEKKEFLKVVKEYAEILTKTIFNVKEQLEIKRFLGNASFRCNKGFPSFREGNYIFVSRRNVDKTHISINEFVPTYLKDNQVYYLGDNKPSVDTPVQLKLYDKLPNIRYMLHSHVYIKDAPTIESTLPCGALEEADEILKYIQTTKEQFNISNLAINLKGHGCLIMSDNVAYFKIIQDKIIARPKPEIIDL